MYNCTDIMLYNYVSRMALNHAHFLLKNVVADLTIPFTNKLSEFIILLLKLNINLRNGSTKVEMI